MHRCESFRTSVIEPILDGRELSAEERLELSSCQDCMDFYRESVQALEILALASEEPDEEFFAGFNDRLRRRIINDRVAEERGVGGRPSWLALLKPLVPAASLLAVMVAVYSSIGPADVPSPAGNLIVWEPVLEIDPGTVDFLERSELFLRTFTKLRVTDVEDLAEAQAISHAQILAIEPRKEAVVDFPPVLMVFEEYENVLRDIRNLPEAAAEEDVADIQERIERNGLVARMKGYQPEVTLVALEQ